VLGAEHPDTLASRSNLAGAYLSAGRPDEAIALYQQTLADYERVLGADHPNALISRSNLATAYQLAGRPAEAASLLERTLARAERVFGPDHLISIRIRAAISSSLTEKPTPGDRLSSAKPQEHE
jgi:tetratricopeptide (TPR) repeat protein